MFDLPVIEAEERKRATEFRSRLLDLGFRMSQYSVYFRFAGPREKAEKMTKQISGLVPDEGRVSLLLFTDKQFEQIINVDNGKETEKIKKPEQLMLF